MTAAIYNLTIEEQAKWVMTLTVPMDLTGYSAYLHIRQKIRGSLIKEIKSPSNGIIITAGATSSTIECTLTKAETLALKILQGVYDLWVVSGGSVPTRLIYGDVHVLPTVTVLP